MNWYLAVDIGGICGRARGQNAKHRCGGWPCGANRRSRRAACCTAGPLALPVALGRAGIKANKREGDGATPRGTFRLKRLWWRADRHPRPATLLPVRRISRRRRLVRGPVRPALQSAGQGAAAIARPTGSRARTHLYDFIIEIDHNTRPRVAGRGSAVFIHVARPGFAPTAGCVALDFECRCAGCSRASARAPESWLSNRYRSYAPATH